MKTFEFKILDDSGRIMKDTAELPFFEISPAIRYLERQGGTVLSIKPLGRISAAIVRVTRGLGRIRRTDLAEVLNNISMMIKAGVPVVTSIHEIVQDLKNRNLARTLLFICTDIESGNSFSDALDRYPNIFSLLIRSTCRVGEETGRLDEMLKKSAQHLLHMEQIMGATKRALLYPVFLAFIVFGAAAFWFVFVVPQLLRLFINMNVELPFLTRLLIMISDAFQNYSLPALIIVIVLIIAMKYLRKRSREIRLSTDRLVLKIPIVSQIIHTSMIARVSEYLGIMLGSGVGVLRTLHIISEATPNEVYKTRLEAMQEHIRSGQTISASMRDTNALHPFAIRMIAIGEQSGRIEEQTTYVAKVYREKLEALVEVLGKSLEPAMLIFLGLIFALIIGGLIFPIYDLIGQLKG